jgi:Spy/CpxP family protein refolding chaperone
MKRMLFVTIASLTLVCSAFAQTTTIQPRRPGRGQRQSRLQDTLGLTDSQVTAVRSLVQGSSPQFQTIQADIKQKRQTYNAILASPSANPVDVGNAALALRASESNLRTAEDSLVAQVKTQLTGDQQQKLDGILSTNRSRAFSLLGMGARPGGPVRAGRGSRAQ